MGYDTDKLSMCGQAIAGPRAWVYEDTGGEAITVYQGAGYFTNAHTLGAKAGDRIDIVDRASDVSYTGYFSAIQDTGTTHGTVRLDTGQP